MVTHHDIKSVGVVFLELSPLLPGVISVKFEVLVTGADFLGDLGFDALVGSDDNPGGAVQFQKLCENETCFEANKVPCSQGRKNKLLPVGPAPMTRASTPTGALSLSRP